METKNNNEHKMRLSKHKKAIGGLAALVLAAAVGLSGRSCIKNDRELEQRDIINSGLISSTIFLYGAHHPYNLNLVSRYNPEQDDQGEVVDTIVVPFHEEYEKFRQKYSEFKERFEEFENQIIKVSEIEGLQVLYDDLVKYDRETRRGDDEEWDDILFKFLGEEVNEKFHFQGLSPESPEFQSLSQEKKESAFQAIAKFVNSDLYNLLDTVKFKIQNTKEKKMIEEEGYFPIITTFQELYRPKRAVVFFYKGDWQNSDDPVISRSYDIVKNYSSLFHIEFARVNLDENPETDFGITEPCLVCFVDGKTSVVEYGSLEQVKEGIEKGFGVELRNRAPFRPWKPGGISPGNLDTDEREIFQLKNGN